ncbi:MAG: hypothetical protein QOC96_1915 [Acidobacteriota bacterium]|jgi:predicted helicase|nr:hypothetical protein [Acidobacteriota bacterium]
MPHINAYLKQIETALVAGNATEHTHRPALKSLLEAIGDGVTATNEPQRIKCGAPDFIVTRGIVPLGYVEAKDVGVSLDRAEESEQLQRYRDSLENLLLTDYLEFRWYVRGELVHTARLATFDAARDRLRVEPDGAEAVEKLITDFLTEVIPTVNSPKELAERMARVARLIRDTILRAFKTEGAGGTLHDQLKGFREVLLHELDEEQFADMYAQTICYGLFAARVNHKGTEAFTRLHAARELPRTNPFLRRLFQHVAGPDLDDEPHAWAVDGLAELLNRTNIAAILLDFGRATRREDPVVHFYETFLAAYDPKMREARGVYYTPEPVVSYIVRSVDHILKTDFRLRAGLADASRIKLKSADGKRAKETHKVLILDPATGTGTFLHGVVNHIYESFRQNRGMWSAYVSEHLLPRLFGFELLMAPYAVAHMKLGLQLAETGYEFDADERLRVYLTNTLEEVEQLTHASAFTRWLNEEADSASHIKQEAPVMVVIGNPPYSGHSANTGQWIANLLRGRDTQTGEEVANYFAVDGKPLGERNPKWLNDDYVKFIRFAQWRIEQTGYGVLAFITNHGYLDNPTFRGMRQSLMETFDDIYVLDLHGNSKKKERAPDGSDDKNVFDIQQGVAIGIFVKKQRTKDKSVGAGLVPARVVVTSERAGTSPAPTTAIVHHAHLWGVRETYAEDENGERVLTGGKYQWLWQHEMSTTKWTELAPQSPFYLFVPQDMDLLSEYEQGWKITELFSINNTGMVTARDRFVIGFSSDEVLNKVRDFQSLGFQEAKEKYELNDVRERTLLESWNMIREMQDITQYLAKVQYRPFDVRDIFYHHSLVRWPVYAIASHMQAGENLGLTVGRAGQAADTEEWNVIYCTRHASEFNLFRRGGNNLFPLYQYQTERVSLFDEEPSDAPGGRRPNLAPEFIADFSKHLNMSFVADGHGDRTKTFGPEDVFAYMYAVFHSPTYRSRYSEFLKIDFPRVPVTSDAELFRALCDAGARLVSLHLMEAQGSSPASFPVNGSNTIEQVRYTAPGEGDAQEGRVWINREQYFAGVAPEVWAFHVGGYQVCQKWLKDRKGRTLSFDDLTHYNHIVAALADTIELMSRLDAMIDTHGGYPLH